MLKIRRPLGRLIFNMGIAIPGKTVFLIETAPWYCCKPISQWHWSFHLKAALPLVVGQCQITPRLQGSWGQHEAYLGPLGPMWAPFWLHEPSYQGSSDTSPWVAISWWLFQHVAFLVLTFLTLQTLHMHGHLTRIDRTDKTQVYRNVWYIHHKSKIHVYQ